MQEEHEEENLVTYLPEEHSDGTTRCTVTAATELFLKDIFLKDMFNERS